MNHWSTRYIGLPYVIGGRTREGLDCWGLLRLFYQEEKNITLPELPGIVENGVLDISRTIIQEKLASWKYVALPEEGCAVAMSQRQVLHHVGIWTDADGGRIIHSWQAPVVADKLSDLRRQRGFKRIEFYCYGTHH